MTAATEDKEILRREGGQIGLPVKTLQTIFGGTLVANDATGYVLPAGDTAAHQFQGVADQYVDNSAGASGAETVRLWRRGLFRMTFATPIAITDVGSAVYVADDNNVDLFANVSNYVHCGVLAEYIDSTHAYVDIEPAIMYSAVAAHISDGSAAHAASAISIADAGTFTAQTQVEAALQELYPRVTSPAAIADPGNAGAIPVTRSGVCAMTSGGAETRTIAAPAFIGQQISLIDNVHAGNIVVTVATTVNQTGNNTLTFGAAADACTLTAMQVAGALVWRATFNDGVALSTV